MQTEVQGKYGLLHQKAFSHIPPKRKGLFWVQGSEIKKWSKWRKKYVLVAKFCFTQFGESIVSPKGVLLSPIRHSRKYDCVQTIHASDAEAAVVWAVENL